MAGMRRGGYLAAAAVGLLAAAGPAAAAAVTLADDDDREFGTGQAVIIVSTPDLPRDPDDPASMRRWRELRSRSAEILERVADRNDLDLEHAIPEIGMLSVKLGAGGLLGLRRQLAGDPRVQKVESDPAVEPRYLPNDHGFTRPDVHAPGGDLGQWNLIRSSGPPAWDLSTGDGAEVAIVDLGTDGSHPDLAPRIAAAQGFGTGSPTVDTNGHGTHTAGLACADSDNGFGIASLGFDCSLYIAKIGGACSDVSAAVTAAANRSSDVISISLGGCRPSIIPALSYALGRGSILVAAADNNPTPDNSCPPTHDCAYPAEWIQPEGTGPNKGLNRGLVVTAAKYDGTRASFAQMTSGVSVAAYGSAGNSLSGGQQGILSTWPPPTVSSDSLGVRTTVNGSDRFAYLVGTSMATPQVSGLAALIRAVQPSMTPQEVVELIKATAGSCGTYGGGLGWGVIRADQAVASALGKDINAPTSKVRSAKRARGAVTIRLKRSDPAGATCIKELPVSGVRTVRVFASANGGQYRRIRKTMKKKIRFRAKLGRRYRFYSVAVDKAGNQELPPDTADAKIRLKRR
jgi:serine protease